MPKKKQRQNKRPAAAVATRSGHGPVGRRRARPSRYLLMRANGYGPEAFGGFVNAFTDSVPAFTSPTAPAVLLKSISMVPVTTSTTTDRRMVVIVGGLAGKTSRNASGALGNLYDHTGGVGVNSQTRLEATNVASLDCDTLAPQSFSIRIRNTTSLLSLGGVVRSLRLPSGAAVSDATTLAELDAIYSMVLTHPRTRVHSATELLSYKQWNAIPTETLSSEKFADKVGSTAANVADSLEDPSLSVFVFVFENTSDINTYEISMAGAWYARFDVNHAMVQAARTVPVVKSAAKDATLAREANNHDGTR